VSCWKDYSSSDLVNGGALRGFDFVDTAESRIGDSRLDPVGASSDRLGFQPSEESNDQRRGPWPGITWFASSDIRVAIRASMDETCLSR
jgi:hypothetical protein